MAVTDDFKTDLDFFKMGTATTDVAISARTLIDSDAAKYVSDYLITGETLLNAGLIDSEIIHCSEGWQSAYGGTDFFSARYMEANPSYTGDDETYCKLPESSWSFSFCFSPAAFGSPIFSLYMDNSNPHSSLPEYVSITANSSGQILKDGNVVSSSAEKLTLRGAYAAAISYNATNKSILWGIFKYSSGSYSLICSQAIPFTTSFASTKYTNLVIGNLFGANQFSAAFNSLLLYKHLYTTNSKYLKDLIIYRPILIKIYRNREIQFTNLAVVGGQRTYSYYLGNIFKDSDFDESKFYTFRKANDVYNSKSSLTICSDITVLSDKKVGSYSFIPFPNLMESEISLSFQADNTSSGSMFNFCIVSLSCTHINCPEAHIKIDILDNDKIDYSNLDVVIDNKTVYSIYVDGNQVFAHRSSIRMYAPIKGDKPATVFSYKKTANWDGSEINSSLKGVDIHGFYSGGVYPRETNAVLNSRTGDVWSIHNGLTTTTETVN